MLKMPQRGSRWRQHGVRNRAMSGQMYGPLELPVRTLAGGPDSGMGRHGRRLSSCPKTLIELLTGA
jgi:hypothetical protein